MPNEQRIKEAEQNVRGYIQDRLLERFDLERRKRSEVQYEMREAELHGKARTSLERAKDFLLEMEKLL